MLAKLASLELAAAEGSPVLPAAVEVNPNCGSISVLVGTVVVEGINGTVPAAAATAAAADGLAKGTSQGWIMSNAHLGALYVHVPAQPSDIATENSCMASSY